MITFAVNFVGVIVAAVLAMAVGFVWYGPLFGKEWAKLQGKDMEKMKKEGGNMGMTYAIAFVGALVISFFFGVFINSIGSKTLMDGAMFGFWAWLGIILPVTGMNAMFMQSNKKLFYIDVFHHLIAFIIVGAVMGMLG